MTSTKQRGNLWKNSCVILRAEKVATCDRDPAGRDTELAMVNLKASQQIQCYAFQEQNSPMSNDICQRLRGRKIWVCPGGATQNLPL